MMEIVKNKEEVKSVMNIIQAFANGKTIQAIDPYEDEWVDQAGLNFKALFEGQYRIKPEPKYRSFKNAEECWAEMQKHKPFGWLKNKENGYYSFITMLNYRFRLNGYDGWRFDEVINKFTFADGTTFGVKEDK